MGNWGGKWAEEKSQVLFLPIFWSIQGNMNVAVWRLPSALRSSHRTCCKHTALVFAGSADDMPLWLWRRPSEAKKFSLSLICSFLMWKLWSLILTAILLHNGESKLDLNLFFSSLSSKLVLYATQKMEEMPGTVKNWPLFCIFNRVIAASSSSASNSSSFLSKPKVYVGTKSQLVGQRVCYIPQKIFRNACYPANFLNF